MEIKTKEDLKKILQDLQAENTLLAERIDSMTAKPEDEAPAEEKTTETEAETKEEDIDEITKLLID